MKTPQDKNADRASIKKAATAGLKASLNILDKWGASTDQAINILQLGRATYFNVKKDPTKANLNNDQIERLSYLLNMHQALRLVFDNPENIYGFMGFENNNEFFNGKKPLDVIATGSFGSLYETFKRIDAMRGAQW